MSNFTAALHEAIAAVCPIDGVSVGRVNDKSTWRIDFADGTTQAQRQAARQVAQAFDVQAAVAAFDAAQVRRRKLARLGEILIAKGIITEADLG